MKKIKIQHAAIFMKPITLAICVQKGAILRIFGKEICPGTLRVITRPLIECV